MDSSALAVEQARKNALLNQMEERVRFECRDVFELLPELEKKGEREREGGGREGERERERKRD